MILLIDNYDSFTYNLVQAFLALEADVRVFRNDELTVAQACSMSPAAVIISPGPCSPNEAGISVELIRTLSGRVPILGVCLGHQAIGTAFGARVSNAARIMHGKTSLVTHQNTPLYKGIKNPFVAGRYHSLAVKREGLPEVLVIDAVSEDGEIMGLHHREHPTYGVQFHPESVLTPAGKTLLRNFLDLVSDWHRQGGMAARDDQTAPREKKV
ncbi:MAG: aminodeoxychorismate/anthranilate synthase component II [Kiritimatiellae bacterium]|nr:aminodeoxychorismate/anthranilate synthase component II [Kiritimatiellia bacterium]